MSTMLIAAPDEREALEWDPADSAAVDTVKEKFDALVGSGAAFAYKTTPTGKEQIKEFDPAAEEIVVTPRMVGG